MKFQRIFLLVLLASEIAFAKSYTKDEIKKMVSKKKYPKLGVVQVSDKEFPMDACEKFVSEQRVGFAEEGWPVKILKESVDLVIVEAWGQNSKTTFKCEDGRIRIEGQDYEI
ncbi:MAG: hypothetical protein V4596_13890 [Bdellovibrionota bacterium]